MPTPDQYRLTLDSGVPEVLEHAPEKFEQLQIKVGRNRTSHGVYREYSNEFTFVHRGADILRDAYYNGSRESKVKFKIEKRNSSGWNYSVLTETDLDLSKFNDLPKGKGVSIQAMESGLVAKLKAREDVEYAIEINGPEVVKVDIPAKLIQGEIRWNSAWPIPAQGTNQSPVDIDGTIYMIKVADTMFNDLNGAPVEAITQDFDGYPASGLFNGNFYLLKARKNIYDMKFYSLGMPVFLENTSGASWNYVFMYEKVHVAGGSVVLATLASGSIPAHTGVTIVVPLQFTTGFNLVADDKVLLTFSTNAGVGDWNVKWEKDIGLKALFKNYTTDIFGLKGLRGKDVFGRLINKLSDGQAGAVSDLLSNANASYIDGIDNKPYDTIWLSGDSIRGAITSGSTVPVIKVKLSDFYRTTNVLWGTGYGIEKDPLTNTENVRLEHTPYFYDESDAMVIADLDPEHVRPFDDSELNFSKANIGCPVQEYDNLNGRDEFNTTQVRLLPGTTSTKDLDLVAPYHFDGYGIFFAWVEAALQDTTDKKTDNEVFLIEVESIPQSTGNYKALHLPGTRSGVIDTATTLNEGLSPLRCLLRNGGFFHACCWGQDNEFIKFQVGDKNVEMESTLSYGKVDEDAPVRIGDLRTAWFQPLLFEVTVKSPTNLIELWAAKPYGSFRFPFRNGVFKGFPMDIAASPTHPIKYTFLLRSAASNDRSKLRTP